MRKRLSSKLLAVILTIAICATTVLGCLMTVSAEASCYTFGTAQFAEDDLTKATIDVTFTANDKLPNGFSAGAFSVVEVDADAEDYLILKDVKPVTEGINLAESEDVDNYYIFDGEAKKSVTFTLTYGFSKGEANDAGKEYKIKLTEVELAYGDGAYFVQDDEAGAVGTISAACKHVIGVVGEPLVTNEPNNYSVYAKSVCTLCGEEFGYQLVPTADKGDLGGDNVPTGTIDLLEFGDYLTNAGSASIYYDTVLADNGETGADWENAIIIDSAEELVYLCKASGNDTIGKYYKVADGIAGFNLANKNLDIDGTLADNLDVITTAGKNHAGGTPGFQGHFDGNGATVYGAWCSHTSVSTYAGLFTCTKGEVTIKNIHVNKAHFTAKTAAGGIIGYHAADSMCTVTVENCSVTDSYIAVTGNGWATAVGGVIGWANSAPSYKDENGATVYVNVAYNVKNCYVNLDEANFVSAGEGTEGSSTIRTCHGGVVGGAGSNAVMVQDCVVIGVTPYSTSVYSAGNDVQHTGGASHYQNVYTDQATGKIQINYNTGWASYIQDFTGRVFQLTPAQMQGSAAVAAMSALDWGNTWVMDGTTSYPRLAAPNEVSDTIYWDGSNTKTAPTVGGGTKDDPYIISTIAEFAYITGQGRDNYAITDGKYYKIADGIKNIVMQPYAYANDIMALNSAAATKSYFEANAAKLKQWLYYGWESSTFCGNIDFGGATVYGIYQVSTNNAGLISNVDAGAVISNLTIKNSYMVSQSPEANYQVGAIAAVTNAGGYGKSTTGFIWLNNCTVANNYLYGNCTSHDRSAVLIGGSTDMVYIDNCLVYGNDATYGSGVQMSIVSSANNSVLVSSAPAIPEGLVVVTDSSATEPRYYNMVRNSIILGALPYDPAQTTNGARFNEYRCYKGVYTDQDVTALANAKPENITTISASSALGSAAQTAMPNLTWGTDWYCGAEGKYPIQKSFATFGTSSVATPDLQLVGTNVTYKNDGSLDLNIHFVPQTAGISPTLYVGTLDGSKFMKLEAVASSQTATLGDNALMYVIPNLSARDIELVWLPTLVYAGSTVVQWGKSEQIALADNARAIIAGDYAQADKNVAAALLNYGAASGAALDSTYDYDAGTVDLLEFGDYLVEAGSTSKYYDTKLADNGETGDSWENAIIIDSAEEFVYLSKQGGGGAATAGKYYKVADGIAGFDLSAGNLDFDGTLAVNLEKIKNGGKNHSGVDPGFQGNFDGNGVTVYGAVINGSTYAAVFPYTDGNVTIKNLNVKLCYFKATAAAAAIIGHHNHTTMSTVTVENCSVTDCYIEATGTGYGCGIGAVIGYGASAPSYTENGATVYVNVAYNIKNCYVNLDEQYFVSAAEDGVVASEERACHGGVMGVSGSNALKVSECVVIGITPYATMEGNSANDVQHSGLETHFANVYTDAPTGKIAIGGSSLGQRDFTGKVFQLTKEQMTGDAAKANMPSLDWNNVWTTTSGYPTFINKNYKAPASGITVTWDGTVATGYASGTGTKEDPYIISTASEFAYMVKDKIVSQAATISPNKYFKVADGIRAFVMQKPEYASEIIALGSAADTKAYFEANEANMLTWPIHGWEGSSFCGYFDGNGATVYGLYQKSGSNAGLFSSVDAGAVISNIALKNSYLTSKAPDYQVAGIAAVSNSGDYGVKQEGVIWINGCTVANNYMYNASTAYSRSGVIAGSFQNDIVMIDNCLTYGNDATYGDGVKMALVGQGNNDVEIAKLKPAELPSYVENSGFFCNTVRNSIILDCDVINEKEGASWRRNAYNCYSNVYTNGTLGETFYNGSWATGYAKVLFPITADDIKGDSATAIVNALNAAPIGETVWYVGAAGDNPGFKAAGTMPSATQALYDGMVLTNADNYGDSVTSFGVYGTGLNLKVNPYMTFTFEFGGDYARSSDVVVTFKSGNTVIETVTAADMVNNVEGGAGRFHLYRLKNAPVTALSTGITVSVTYGGVTTDFGTYSAEGFAIMADNASKLEPCDYYANLYEASKALLFYADMLAARYSA